MIMAKNKDKGRKHMAEEEKKEVAEEAPVEEQAAGQEATEEVSCEEQLRSRIKELEDEVADMKDRLLRDAADTENYRKRLRLDKENAVKYANESIIKDLLDPLDNFSRAIEAAEKTKDFETMRQGVVMVQDQILTLLRRNWGLEPFSPEGMPFDPAKMEACMMQEDDKVETETVSQVFMKGYILNGKVIRPAKVVVAKPKKDN